MQISPFLPSDLPVLTALQPPDWQDIRPNFEPYVQLDYCFPIKIEQDGQIIGVGALIVHQEQAWLGHIIVHPEYRNRGIGAHITRTLLDMARARHCETINLIATDMGAPVYEKLGFETVSNYWFFKDIEADPKWSADSHILPYSDALLEQMEALDYKISREKRFFRLKTLLSDARFYCSAGRLEGFHLPALGEGLIVADTERAGIALMKQRFLDKRIASFPEENSGATHLLKGMNIQPFRSAKRMRMGKQQAVHYAGIYNRIGGNLG